MPCLTAKRRAGRLRQRRTLGDKKAAHARLLVSPSLEHLATSSFSGRKADCPILRAEPAVWQVFTLVWRKDQLLIGLMAYAASLRL
jgi:hypothetical protein